MLTPEEVGKLIVKCRVEHGLNQRQLAEVIGTSSEMLCSYERGRRYPSVFIVLLICEVLGVEPNDLLTKGDKN